MIEQLLLPEVQQFIKDHLNDDPFHLSLNTKKDKDFPLSEAIEQIQSRQKAKNKLPNWLKKEGLIFPPPISIEQSSSERTADFKASLIRGKSMVDLTGGMGVDTSYFANHFEGAAYVEPDEKLCELARHNFKTFEENIKVCQSTAEDFLNENKAHFDAFFIDPSRRIDDRRVFKLEDCVPNLCEIVPICLQQADHVLIKLSPLVDLSLLINDFAPTDLWVVAVKGEVKEVLCLLKQVKKPAKTHAIDLLSNGEKTVFEFDAEDETSTQSEFSLPLQYIYEPNAAILKAGSFKLIGARYKLKKLHQNTHLYTSDEIVENFPGKTLKIREFMRQNKKEVKSAFPSKKVNVITRNFPLSSIQLKKKYALQDGGDNFLIGTTLKDGKRVLLWCERLV